MRKLLALHLDGLPWGKAPTQKFPGPGPNRAGLAAAPDAAPERGMFQDLPLTRPSRSARWGKGLAFCVHVLVIGLALLVPLLVPLELPERRDYVRALLYDPPPPPPPPLPRGAGLVSARQPVARPTPPPERAAPSEAPLELPRAPAETGAAGEGSPTGSELGVPEGLEGGVPGGVVGGVPGGVLGGVIGGTGDIPAPVSDYDRPPRLLRQVKPDYPKDAFAKKLEGVVVVELLIDASGRVVRVRVVQSTPLLDAAAVAAVRQWTFQPALKQGQPVATIAYAPISFRIY